jgi:hypothetical protein
MAEKRPAVRQDLRRRAAAEYEKARALYAGLRDQGALPKADLPHIEELAALAEKFTRAAQ